MRNVTKIFFVVALLGTGVPGAAQQRHKAQEDRSPGRLQKFKTMRLIEVLKLNDEDAARFTAIQRIHDDSTRALIKERNERIDDINKLVRGEGPKEGLEERTADVLAIDQRMFDERKRYHQELQRVFTPEQFAKFLVFDRNFNSRVREAIEDLRSKIGDRIRE